jgi:hypothetical protein
MKDPIGRYVTAQNLMPGDLVVNGRNVRLVVSKCHSLQTIHGKKEEVVVMHWMGRRWDDEFELEFWTSSAQKHALFSLIDDI